MDSIQKVLVQAGRKDLAQEYYKKVAVQLPQHKTLTQNQIVEEIMRLIKEEKRGEKDIKNYFEIVYPNVKLTQQHFNQARAKLMTF